VAELHRRVIEFDVAARLRRHGGQLGSQRCERGLRVSLLAARSIVGVIVAVCFCLLLLGFFIVSIRLRPQQRRDRWRQDGDCSCLRRL
jgi:hypothetical protein